MTDPVATIHWNDAGLVPAIVQDAHTRDVLMLAWMNAEALHLTRQTGQAHFWSRSRQEIWHKGATSGNVQYVTRIRLNDRGDAILLEADPAGPACHTGAVSCFFRHVSEELA